jgi:hypothetical protein
MVNPSETDQPTEKSTTETTITTVIKPISPLKEEEAVNVSGNNSVSGQDFQSVFEGP